MDSKLQITIHEHWYKWVAGQESFFDLKIFYPEVNTLGYSDTLIIPGFFHTILKFFGFETIQSWQISNILILFLGIFCVYVFTNKLINNWLVSWLITFIFLVSHTFLENLSGQPNTVNYLLFFVIPITILNLVREGPSNLKIYINFSILVIFIPLIAISTWYVFFLGFLYSIFFLIIYCIFNTREFILSSNTFFTNVLKLKRTFIAISIGTSVLLWILFVFIYLEKAKNTENLWIEVSRTEITFNNLFSSFVLNSFFLPAEIKNNYLYNSNYVSIGLGSLPVILLFLIPAMLAIFNNIRSKNFTIIYISTCLYSIFFISIKEFSLFRFFWNEFILFESIRYTYRANIYVAYFIILLGVYLLFKISTNIYYRVFSILFIGLLFLNQWQEAPSKWRITDYHNLEYESITKALAKSNCKTFVVDTPGKGWWDDQLSGLQIMKETSIPTLNGYSGDYPLNYLASDWSKDSQLLQVGRWLNLNRGNFDFCRVTPTSIQILNSTTDIVHDKNFDVVESNSEPVVWSWALDKTSYLKILNFTDKESTSTLNFKVKLPNCSSGDANFSYQLENMKTSSMRVTTRNQPVNMEFKISGNDEKYIKLTTDFEGCSVDNDPRKLFYQVQLD